MDARAKLWSQAGREERRLITSLRFGGVHLPASEAEKILDRIEELESSRSGDPVLGQDDRDWIREQGRRERKRSEPLRHSEPPFHVDIAG